MSQFIADLLVIAASVALWQPLARGIGLGLGAAIPIGPVNIEIARRALRHGFLAGAALGLGAVTVDVFYAVLSTLSFVKLFNQPVVILPIAALGTGLLAYLGVQCLRAARKAWTTDPLDVISLKQAQVENAASRHTIRRAYVTGLLMTLLNPMTLVFWFVAVPGAVARLTENARADLPLVAAGVFAGALGWVCFFTWLIGHLGRFGRERWLRWVDLAGGIVLLAFAIGAIWRVLRDAL